MCTTISTELSARSTTAAAVLADYRAELASVPLTKPPGREWMLRLADALGLLLDGLAADDEPVCGEGAQIHGLSCGCSECDNDEDEPYCTECGADVGIFIGHGDAWLHYAGQGTTASPIELYDPGHAPVVAWRFSREATS